MTPRSSRSRRGCVPRARPRGRRDHQVLEPVAAPPDVHRRRRRGGADDGTAARRAARARGGHRLPHPRSPLEKPARRGLFRAAARPEGLALVRALLAHGLLLTRDPTLAVGRAAGVADAPRVVRGRRRRRRALLSAAPRRSPRFLVQPRHQRSFMPSVGRPRTCRSATALFAGSGSDSWTCAPAAAEAARASRRRPPRPAAKAPRRPSTSADSVAGAAARRARARGRTCLAESHARRQERARLRERRPRVAEHAFGVGRNGAVPRRLRDSAALQLDEAREFPRVAGARRCVHAADAVPQCRLALARKPPPLVRRAYATALRPDMVSRIPRAVPDTQAGVDAADPFRPHKVRHGAGATTRAPHDEGVRADAKYEIATAPPRRRGRRRRRDPPEQRVVEEEAVAGAAWPTCTPASAGRCLACGRVRRPEERWICACSRMSLPSPMTRCDASAGACFLSVHVAPTTASSAHDVDWPSTVVPGAEPTTGATAPRSPDRSVAPRARPRPAHSWGR